MHQRTAVLAVDDNATVRRTLAARLGAHDMSVMTADNGRDALELISKHAFDLILLDLQMPQVPGLEVLEAIRKRYKPSQLPVIMLTSSEDSADIVAALEKGANDYVIKPGELQVLLARIHTHVALKAVNEALREAHHELERKVVHQTVELEQTSANYRNEHESRIETELELKASETRYRTLYDENPCMLFTLKPSGEILSANRLAAGQLGYRRAEVIGRSMVDLCHVDDRDSIQEHINAVVDMPERLHRWELRKVSRSGEVLWLRETARVINEHGREPSILVVCEDITEIYQLSERLSYQTKFDSLTGLLNRTSFEERLTALVERGLGEDAEHALLYLDLDQFKVINDTCGHAAGDELVRQLSLTLNNVVRRRDVLARWGGDEFAVLIEDCAIAPAKAVAEALRSAIANHRFEWLGKSLPVSASIGIVPISFNNRDPATILSMADAACYAAKDAGRNRIHVHSPDDMSLLKRYGDMDWVTRINEALAENRFHLTTQSITPVSAGALHGEHFEILLRMNDANGNEIPPGQFLSAAERYNMAVKIDRWVVENAFKWLREHPEFIQRLYLCDINLSGQSLGDEHMLEFLISQFDRHSIPGNKLCFEVTETAAISDFNNALRFIRTFKERGCRFALDDFGSGLSSFAYLKNLPVDFVKIDGAFVRDIAKSSVDLAMVKSINDVGHVMGKQTIAEFVEDAAILAELRALGVDYAQGYTIDRPLPIDRRL